MKSLAKVLMILYSITCTAHLDAQVVSQTGEDTLPASTLDSVTIRARLAGFLPDVQGMNIYAGKKTNVIQPDPSKGNMPQNLARTIFARIPGLTLWDMDGAGTQLNIGSRGTDTHRSIEMNMRQNGYNTNSDMFGYPENHYTPPMQGIDEVQLVRGSAALQFGSQFGGMMNFVMKEGDTSRVLSAESEQTAGSNGFFNSFNAVGGTSGKVSYYAYYDNRHGNGWRQNAAFNYQAYYASIRYRFNERGSVALQFSRMDYRQQIAGGLTDAQFQSNPRQSFRARNFFNPEINIPALLFNYNFTTDTRIEVTAHALTGQRNSVQFINTPDIGDTLNAVLGTLNPRQVDRDYYNGFTTEARILHQYQLGKMSNVLSGGLRYFSETTKRRQKGVGTIASDFDLGLAKPYGIDLRLHSDNYAAFVENVFQLTPGLSFTPGVRFEVIRSLLNGVINNASFPVSYTGNRSFPLFGAGLQYQANAASQFYGNVSQAYRPYIYANVTPADRVDIIDPNLKDSKGYDIDLGYRGNYKMLVYDVNAFYVFYGNRAGQLTLKNQNNTNYLFTTNIGNAVAKGVEAYVGLSLTQLFSQVPAATDFRLFNSFSYTHARYTSGEINKSGVNTSLKNNYVEGVPELTNRTGLSVQHKSLVATVQYSYVGKNFSDANNTAFNPSGATGVVPAYQVWDFSANWNFLEHYRLSGGINNFTNVSYFTRRINMYPGPGILPADGRTFYVSMGVKF